MYEVAYDPKLKKWVVYKQGDRSKVFGKHPNKASALAQQRAMYADMPASEKKMMEHA